MQTYASEPETMAELLGVTFVIAAMASTRHGAPACVRERWQSPAHHLRRGSDGEKSGPVASRAAAPATASRAPAGGGAASRSSRNGEQSGGRRWSCQVPNRLCLRTDRCMILRPHFCNFLFLQHSILKLKLHIL
jgi:hypothetical protein